MVNNGDLFRKVMMFSKELKMSAMRGRGADGREGFPHPGHVRHGGPTMPPPPFGDGERPPFPPSGCGRGHGLRGGGMSREHMLIIISEYPDGVRQKELAEKAGINASSTSEVVSRLEDDGYLIRTVDESDRRATVLKLTEMGAVRAEEIRDEREEFLDEFFGRLSEGEKQTLSDLLDKLLDK